MHTKLLALIIVIGIAEAYQQPAFAQGKTGGISPQDYWRLQSLRAGAANQYFKYSGGDRSQYNQFGTVSSIIERIDKTLQQDGKHLSEYDFYELSGRVNALKQQVGAGVSRGEDGSYYKHTLQSLEDDVTLRVNETLSDKASAQKGVTSAFEHLNEMFSGMRDKLSDSDRAYIEDKIRHLKEKCQPGLLGDLHANEQSQLINEAHHLESAIASRAQQPTVLSGLVSRHESPAAEQKKEAEAAPPEPTAAPTRDPLPTHPASGYKRRVPPPSLPKIFEKVENRLLTLREVGGLGTFDMDRYTARLLKVKEMQKKMMSKTGHLSLYQESLLRDELNIISTDIENQIDGK